jgi:hypothetical protein
MLDIDHNLPIPPLKKFHSLLSSDRARWSFKVVNNNIIKVSVIEVDVDLVPGLHTG